MRVKQAGISILISMGTSTLVLTLAFATLNSIARSLDQASNIQRSTQLFFASESGAEAAFFHHNARGAGLSFPGPAASQSIAHDSIDAATNWSIEGRSTTSDTGSATVGDATVVDILRENQSLQIPLQWDASADPSVAPPSTPAQHGRTTNANENVSFTFYLDPADFTPSTAADAFNNKYNFASNIYPISNSFDFGENGNNAVLVDWSFTRNHSRLGVQTFIPTDNQDCSGFLANPGYICENDYVGMTSTGLQVDTNDTISGKILPGSIDTELDYFWDCADPTVIIGDTCSDYQLTIRSLLELNDTITGDKVPGLPYELKITRSGSIPLTFPQSTYTVTSDVALEDFSQQISIEVPEKTSIGAFDYVIFD